MHSSALAVFLALFAQPLSCIALVQARGQARGHWPEFNTIWAPSRAAQK